MSCNGGMVGSVVCLCLCFGHRMVYVSLTYLDVGCWISKESEVEVELELVYSRSMDSSGTEEVE